jgi:putative peptidoglycan lipid II flippase
LGSLVRGGLVVGSGILIGNVTGFFRVGVTAYLLGTHARADALAVALGPIDSLNSAIVNTMLVSFVPMLLLRPESDRALVFARAARVLACFLTALSLATALLASNIVSILGPGLAPAQHLQAVALVRIASPATLLAGASALFGALLYTERRFFIPALYQACLNGCTIVAALSLWKFLGAQGFAIGYVVGAGLQLAIAWAASRDILKRHRIARKARPLPVPMREIIGAPGMFLAYAGLLSANIIVTRAFATHAGPGMAAAFDYCLRCVSVVIAYLVYPVSNSLLPEIARLSGLRRTREAYRLIDNSIGMMAVFAVLACALGVALRTPVISILFERGSFTAESTLLVSGVFLGFAPGIIGWSLFDLVARCLFALDRPRLPVFAAVIPLTVNLIAMQSFGRVKDPVLICAGASAGLLAAFAALFLAIHLRRPSDGPQIPEPHDEENRESVHHGVHFAEPAAQHLQQSISAEPEREPVRD